MSVITENTSRVAIELGSQEAVRLIERAQRTNRPVTLSFSRLNRDESIVTSIVRTDTNSLTLMPHEGPSPDLLPSTCLEVNFILDGQTYFFSSSVLAEVGPHIEIMRSNSLHTWQRRRFLRAHVADSTSVTLTHASSFANRIGEGAMLNLSPDGLACRISRELSDS
ncbi:MAG: hypothetical protein GXP29_14400, partial [Planctomycetes bacterium]|nr:hypothetical protein [Planctomycetota bacterium]